MKRFSIIAACVALYFIAFSSCKKSERPLIAGQVYSCHYFDETISDTVYSSINFDEDDVCQINYYTKGGNLHYYRLKYRMEGTKIIVTNENDLKGNIPIFNGAINISWGTGNDFLMPEFPKGAVVKIGQFNPNITITMQDVIISENENILRLGHDK